MRMIVKKNVKKVAKQLGVKQANNTDGAFRDLMANMETEVQRVLEEEGIPV